MKKLKLNLNDLKVESFATTPAKSQSGGGTVFGYTAFPSGCNTCELDCDATGNTCGDNTCGNNTCDNTCANNTCGNTCAYTCANTCANTCDVTCIGIHCGEVTLDCPYDC